MATITLKGQPIQTSGELPEIGKPAPEFKLTKADLSETALSDFGGKKLVLNMVPSLDTSVCALSAKRFNEEVGKLEKVTLLNISADLPFAQARFCDSEKLEHVVSLSTFRSSSFGRDYGVQIIDGPLAGLISRAVLVLDAEGLVVYGEQVPEIVQEPDYAAALAALTNG